VSLYSARKFITPAFPSSTSIETTSPFFCEFCTLNFILYISHHVVAAAATNCFSCWVCGWKDVFMYFYNFMLVPYKIETHICFYCHSEVHSCFYYQTISILKYVGPGLVLGSEEHDSSVSVVLLRFVFGIGITIIILVLHHLLLGCEP